MVVAEKKILKIENLNDRKLKTWMEGKVNINGLERKSKNWGTELNGKGNLMA